MQQVHRLPITQVMDLPWEHLLTTKSRPFPARSGTTIWIAVLGDGKYGAITWDWSLLDKNMVGVSDMLGVSSNVYPINSDGVALDSHERRLVLAAILNTLDWQRVIRDVVDDGM